MALEDIFRALEEQADKDVEAVLAESRAHAEAIREEAEREAAVTREHRIAEAERVAKARSAQELNSVKLEARKRVAAVKERAVREAFDQALASLSEVRTRSDYPAIFAALLDEAIASLEPGWELVVDPADVDLARSTLASRGIAAEVRGDISTAGGMIISMRGGTVTRRNTLEDRLDKLRGKAQAEVAELLFA